MAGSRRGAIFGPMAILKIARMGHPILATPARAVADPRHPEIRRLVNDMVETMIDANGAGLAAVRKPSAGHTWSGAIVLGATIIRLIRLGT